MRRTQHLLRRSCLALALGAGALPRVASGQVSVAATQEKGDTARRTGPLFTRRDALTAGAFAVATVAMFPLDHRFARSLQNPSAQANRFLDNAATGVEWIATPGSFWIGTTIYAAGRLARQPRLADLGLHGLEALALSSALHGTIKNLAGRARPFVSSDTAPHDFSFLRGLREGGDYRSFPSGHASGAFAAASAVTAEAARWKPQYAPYVGVAMYGGATLVALSRMYHDRHWASDVVLGAALGTFSGWKVVQYNHDNPNNRLDRLLLSATVMPDGRGGMVVGWRATP